MIHTGCSLKNLNTFHIEAKTKFFTEAHEAGDLIDAIRFANERQASILVLGGGSNVLFTKDFDGIAIRNCIRGFKPIRETDEHVWIRIGGGEEWHGAVERIVGLGYGGVENLSLIPGTVGAAPMQNIGAYGVELCEVFDSLEALEMDSGQIRTFNLEECEFGYRKSVFKNKHKGKYIIVSVTLRLTKKPVFNISYGALKTALQAHGILKPTVKDISDVIIQIRKSKLPDPEVLGNAGSFFKNPSVGMEEYERMKRLHPEMPAYPDHEGSVKLSAAWLIERCGWKGKRLNDAGVHEKHALVLVNYGSAKGEEIKALADNIRASVYQEFGVKLETEVNII